MRTQPIHRLSKSRVTEFLQCPKRLYLSVHHPGLREDSIDLQARFNIGHQVGELAQSLFPNGIMIGDKENNLKAALIQTQQVLLEYPERPIFEATFQHEGMLIRADILIPTDVGHRMIEVKSSTSVKDYYLTDCAMQSWVIEHCGIKLTQVSLMNINSDFIYEELGNYRELFKETDITENILSLKQKVPEWLSSCADLLTGEMPSISIGDHCSSPFECPFYLHCSAGQPEFSVELLPRNKARGTIEKLKAKGYEDLRSVPVGEIDHPLLEKIRRTTVSGEPELDFTVRGIIKELPYPRYYLDFETIQFTVPIWLGTSPFEQLPFQWSCHVENENGTLAHLEFLDISGTAPMRAFAENLVNALGETGPVIVYNQAFENGRMRELAKLFPDLAPQLEAIITRTFDLLPLAREHYYHPDMKGSWSIKAVLPTVAPELNYGDLEEVQHGGHAQQAYLEAIESNTLFERKNKLEQSLLEYCKLDTLAMVKIAHFFEGRHAESSKQ